MSLKPVQSRPEVTPGLLRDERRGLLIRILIYVRMFLLLGPTEQVSQHLLAKHC